MKKVFLFFAAILMAVVASAQVDEVTLTVIGTGINEEKATLQALRSAIEQSFGTFVSANTTILNDKLVQDEIVSVSNGNVKDYQKLAVIALPNGQISVSVQATISVKKLITYAKAKGSKTEFAGNALVTNLKLEELQINAAKKAIQIMKMNLLSLCHNVFDYEIRIGTISSHLEKRYKCNNFVTFNDNDYDCKVTEYFLPIYLDVYSNEISSNIVTLISSTLQSFRKNNMDVSNWEEYREVLYEIEDAVCKDFLKIKIKKIGEQEYYSFSSLRYDAAFYAKSVPDHYMQFINKKMSDKWLYSSNRPITLLENSIYYNDRQNGYAYIGNGKHKVSYADRKIGTPLINLREDLSILKVNKVTDRIEISRKPTESELKLIKRGKPLSSSQGSYSIIKNGNDITIKEIKYEEHLKQNKVNTFSFLIPLTMEEMEHFKGLEIVGASAPKYTGNGTNSNNDSHKYTSMASTTQQTSSAISPSKGYTLLYELTPKQTYNIASIRVLINKLPPQKVKQSIIKKVSGHFPISYDLVCSSGNVECKWWEFTGDPFASAIPNYLNGNKTLEYIDFDIHGNCAFNKISEELGNAILIKLNK